MANLGGLALGPLVAGALLSWAGHPFTTSYIVFIALMVIGAVLISLSPETVDLSLPRSAGAPRFVLRHAQNTVFIGAAAVAFCSFAIFGLFSSVGSLIVHTELHETSPFIWGLAGFVVLGVSALAQTLFAKPQPAKRWSMNQGSTAGVLAVFFVVAYLGLSLPVLLTVATHLISSRSALIVFSAVILAVSVVAARLQVTALRK